MPSRRSRRRAALLLISLPLATATTAPTSLPQVDFSRMGQVGLGGSFAGLDWWTSSSPFASTSTGGAKFSADGASLFMQNADGSFTVLGSTNPGGLIHTLCWSNSVVSSSDSASNGTLYVGGVFSSLSGTSSSNIVAYSLSDNSFHPLSTGLSGPVQATYCDNTNGLVWFGGDFTAPSGQSGENVALWSATTQAWQAVPFGGLDGPVGMISQGSSASSVLFGGQFTTVFAGGNSTNSSSQTSVASAPSDAITSGLSGYLTPVTIPSASAAWGNLTITAGPSTDQPQYSDPSVLLCPGSGTYLGRDNSVTQVEILSNSYLMATGARVSNAQVEGRSATAFCITSLPDNTQLNMTYVDPKTGKNATCWEHCPLSSDSSVGAQDFVFTDGTRSLTGLQLQLKEWTGDGPGLSGLQLLSDGAYASAVQSANTGRCSGSSLSSVQQSGQWTEQTGPTNIAGTVSPYVTASVPVASSTYPSITFYPYVSSGGYYNVYMVIPGCDGIGDCAGRSSVDVEVFPTAGGLGWTSTITEQVHADTKSLVYSGWIDPTTSGFSTTISVALAKNPAAPASGDNYVIVAQSVELVLTGVYENGQLVGSTGNGTNSTSTTTSSTNAPKTTAFGVFEYVRSTSYNVSAASSTLSNATETAVTQLGFSLASALNSSNAMTTGSVNTIATYSGTAFVAGNFVSNNNYSNIVMVSSDGKVSSPASQGVDGVVHASVVVNDHIYFGGEFTSTAQSGTTLQRVAQYDPKANTWAALGGGVDGSVLSLSAVPGSSSQILVTGNFSNALDSNNTATRTGGMAVWDASKSAWVSTGGVLGNVSVAASSSASCFLAGRVVGTTSNSVNGIAMLSTDHNGEASISSVTGANLDSVGSGSSSSATSMTAARKRDLQAHRTRSLLTRFATVVRAARPILGLRATAPTIQQQSYDAPAILAGAFWTNSSAKGNPNVTLLGGNFTSGSALSEIEGLAFYTDNQLSSPSHAVTGVVRTVAVIGNDAWVGGSGVNVSEVGSGLVIYDLAEGAWKKGKVAALNPASGSSLVINAIKQRPNSNTTVVAGNFGSAGSLTCPALCLWDSSNTQWNQPSSALTSGEIRSMDFADDNSDTLVVAGSFILNGAVSYVASYSFGNSTWRAMPGLPGPALAIAVDDKNAGSIFASGYSASDNTPYLQAWNGQQWSAQNQSLQTGSLVQQLAFVPMVNEHAAVGSIEKDRMLMVSGELYLENIGNASLALYDGSSWYPYLVAQASTGTLGAVSALFWSESSFSFAVHHYLARGLVVLVAIAIATGLILLLILLGLLYAYIRRRIENRHNPPPEVYEKEGSIVSSTHQTVFNSVQAALEQSLAPGVAAGNIAAASSAGPKQKEGSLFGAAAEAPSDSDDEEEGRVTYMRFDFDGPELQPGEMSMKAGQELLVLDDQASREWFYARDPATGREGVVPASYIW